MKKLFLLVIGLIIISPLFADEEFQFQTINDKVILHFENKNPEINQQKIGIDKVLAVPSDNVEVVINNCEVSLYTKDGKFIRNAFVIGNDRVQLIKSFVVRELKAHQIKIKLLDEDEKNISVLKNIDMELVPKDAVEKPINISQTFLPIYKSLVN
ncbi:MAG: hypothetical protein KAW92_12365, partial [Candidatus Cloacimonetes bacterium]|nr:hypothetical protein [Candidatus Cloacimonadota bacterium]